MTQNIHIQTSALFGIEMLLKELGVDPALWLKQFELCLDDVGKSHHTMPLEKFVTLLQQGAEEFNCLDFGLRLGSKQDFRILGPLGLLLQNSETPRQALASARSFMSYHNQSEFWDHSQHGHQVYLKRYEIFHDYADTRQYKELSLSACFQLCRLLLGENFQGTRIEFQHAPLSDKKVYDQYFKMPVVFNSECDQMVVPAQYLDRSIENANAAVQQFTQHYLTQFKKENDHDTVQQISTLIQQTISYQDQSIDHIAQLLGTSRRTLQRRLKDKGVVFKELLNDIRIKTAKWYLTSSQVDITLLSEILGYSDVSGFSRAFKKKTGIAPLAWRKTYG